MRRTRDELLRLLRPGLGDEAAAALVDEMEAADFDRLVTRDDLARTRDVLSELIAGIGGEVGELRGDVGELRRGVEVLEARMDGRLDTLRESIGRAKEEILAAYRGEIGQAVQSQTRAIIVSMFATVGAIGGLAIGLAQFA